MRRMMMAIGLVLVAGCSRATEPTAPLTVRDAEVQVDAAVTPVNWAVQDAWLVGGRDLLVWVQIDTAVAPRLFQVVRDGPVTDAAALARHRAVFAQALPALQRAADLLWALGGRDVLVSAEGTLVSPPHYFRLPRKAR